MFGMRRFKSPRYVHRPPLAFRVFGEIRPLHTMVVLPVWSREGAPPDEMACSSHAVAEQVRRRLIEADLAQYEAYCREH